MPGGVLRTVFAFAIREGRIAQIDLVMDADRLGGLNVEILPPRDGVRPTA
jgi:hypothetical protein